MHQWTRKHKKPCASLQKIINQILQHGSFFINTGKTGKWRIEFHSASFPVIIEKKQQTDIYMQNPWFTSLKGWKFLAYKILVLVTKPENLGTSWPQCFFVPCDAPFACNACLYKGLLLKNCRKAFFNDLLLVFPATSSNWYSILKQSSVKCLLHTYTFVSFFGMNLSSWRSCSNHFFGNFLFFAGKLRKVTPLSLSFSVRVLQPGAQHFSSQLNKRI